MFVTPQEASQRWCPFGRQPTFVGSQVMSANRQPNGDVPSCLGPLCMAWHWEKEKPVREIDPVTNELMDEAPRRGYCALAGKPDVGE